MTENIDLREYDFQAGFTLIEVVAVLVVIGILSSVAVEKFYDLTEQARRYVVVQHVAELQSRINAQFASNLLKGQSCSEAVGSLTIASLSDHNDSVFGQYKIEGTPDEASVLIPVITHVPTQQVVSNPNVRLYFPKCEGSAEVTQAPSAESVLTDMLAGKSAYLDRNNNYELGSAKNPLTKAILCLIDDMASNKATPLFTQISENGDISNFPYYYDNSAGIATGELKSICKELLPDGVTEIKNNTYVLTMVKKDEFSAEGKIRLYSIFFQQLSSIIRTIESLLPAEVLMMRWRSIKRKRW